MCVFSERNQNASSSNSRNVWEEHVENGVGMLEVPIDNPPQYEEILPSAPLLPATGRVYFYKLRSRKKCISQYYMIKQDVRKSRLHSFQTVIPVHSFKKIHFFQEMKRFNLFNDTLIKVKQI